MSWWPWELEARVANLEKQLDAVWQYLENFTKGTDMSRLHDKLATLASDLNMSADTVIANATENETQFQDVITTLEAVVKKLRQKIDDDASQGSSTGGGSGAR
jgi:uncharacterized coiled-coil protein SlyX